MATPQEIITQVAQELGVDPKLALAIAQQESGFNPYAVGDNGHSVGLFQLNDAGEGAGMGNARYDPTINARTALSVVAQVAAQHPDWSPGQIAAAAQRPSDPVAYASSVNAIYGGQPNSQLLGTYRQAQGMPYETSGTPTATTTPVAYSLDPQLAQLFADTESQMNTPQGTTMSGSPTTGTPVPAPYQGSDGIWHYPQPDGHEELSYDGPSGTGQPQDNNTAAYPPAEVLQAIFNGVLAMAQYTTGQQQTAQQQATGSMEQAGLAPQMQWDPNLYGEGKGGFRPTGQTMPTLAALNQQFQQNETRLNSIANLAALNGQTPLIRIGDDGSLQIGVDAMGNPIYEESTASRNQRLAAGEAVGFVSADLLRPPQDLHNTAAKYIPLSAPVMGTKQLAGMGGPSATSPASSTSSTSSTSAPVTTSPTPATVAPAAPAPQAPAPQDTPVDTAPADTGFVPTYPDIPDQVVDTGEPLDGTQRMGGPVLGG